MTERTKFRRIVLGLPYHKPRQGMRLGADLARLLDLDLLGLFVKEESLLGLASLPFIRELKLLGGGWRQLDFDQLSHDFEIAAKDAERAFTEAVKALPTTCRFEVVKGSMADTIASISREGDIVLLFREPESSAQGESPALLAALNAAFQCSAAVLLVPTQIARQSGAIVAIATHAQDPSIEAASAVAAAAKEDLIVVDTFASDGEKRLSEVRMPTGVRVRRISANPHRPINASSISFALRQISERLVVMTRGDDAVPSMIASMRYVPVLVV